MKLEDLTIGIEEEYQIVDPKTGELTSFISEFLEQGAVVFRDQVKPELLQSQVEVGSKICQDIREAREELTRLRRVVAEIADKNNRKILAAGTHPFSRWQDQIITDKDRYKALVASMQYIARRLLIFGMHLHVAIPDRQLRIDVMNQLAYFMPHILCLSTSSPFWLGNNTGLKSYRSVVFQDLPRTGLPEYFNTAGEYDQYVNTLIKTGCIDEATKIWWDIRPHPKFPTLEIRICDCMTKIDDVIAVAAMLQALVAKLIQLRVNNQSWRIYRRALLRENKWRAMKDGVEGRLLDLGKEQEVPVCDLVEEMIQLVQDTAEQLGTREEIERLREICKDGTSADRQIRKFKETNDLKAVVAMLAEETVQGC